MTDMEHQANASLRALADAYQGGLIDRAAYRARRRRVLQTLVENVQAERQVKASMPDRDLPDWASFVSLGHAGSGNVRLALMILAAIALIVTLALHLE